jgi:hypothetical protein
MSAQTGGKAELGEVSPSTSSCILQRSLDVVPRAGCTGPSGLAFKGEGEKAVAEESFVKEAAAEKTATESAAGEGFVKKATTGKGFSKEKVAEYKAAAAARAAAEEDVVGEAASEPRTENDPDWDFFEQWVESCLKGLHGIAMNMEVPQEQREKTLDSLAEAGMAALQASINETSSEARTALGKNFHQLRVHLRRRLASLIPS